MTDENVAFLPFHAIASFMRPDYKLDVVRRVVQALPNLPNERRAPIDRLTRLVVTVPGFRNSAKAPSSVKIRPLAESFDKNHDLAGNLLAAWAESLPELRQQTYDLLVERGWEILPPEADRTQLPGFLTTWPKGEDFEVLNQAFREKYPGTEAKEDDVSLMAVWVSARLPYEEDDDEELEEEAEAGENGEAADA